MNDKKKVHNQRVKDAIAEIEKSYGPGAIMCLGDGPPRDELGAVPTGSLALDRALGIGGYPRGRIVEIYGPESSGKTTLTLHAIAEMQKAGGLAAFVDAEHAFDPNYAKTIGVDPHRLLVSQPDFGEQGLGIAETLARTEAIDLVVLDSVAALVPKAEIDGDMGDNHVGLHARLMSQALRKITAIADRTHTTFLFINQLRQKIGVVFGSPETTTGGQALKFYSSIRLDVRRIGKVTAGDTVVGNRTRVKVVKNKCAPPFTEAEFDIRWGTGIDSTAELLDFAEARGAVCKNGSHYSFEGKSFAQGREKAREALLASPDMAAAIRKVAVPPRVVETTGIEAEKESKPTGKESKRAA